VLEGEIIKDTLAIFTLSEKSAIAVWRLGRGEVILLACPEVFQNDHIGKADHLSLLKNIVGGATNVYFDEYIHGSEGQAGILEIVSRWGFGPFLIVLGLVVLIAFWRFSYRLGPGEDDYRETRIEAIDFMDSLAMLYDRAVDRHQAILMYRNAFARSVCVNLGLRGEALDGKVMELLKGSRFLSYGTGKDISEYEFKRELMHINNAFRRLEDGKTGAGDGKTEAAVRAAR
jgi:hypothetical protein